MPDFLGSKTTQGVLIFLYGLITAICLDPPAALLGAKISFEDVVRFAVISLSFSFVFVAVQLLLASLLFIELSKVRVTKLTSTGESLIGCVWMGFIALLLGRALFVGYETLYGFGFWKLCFAIVGSFAVSVIVTPVIFVPLLFVILRFKQLIELFI